MILELHLIQNFAPSNLNRSDTGSPKDCIFGGFRRARISSQCFKRAMREYFRANFADGNRLAERTSRLVEEISDKLVESGQDKEASEKVVTNALGSIGIKMNKKNPSKTAYLLFFGRDEIEKFTEVCGENFDELLSDDVSKDTVTQLKGRLDGGKAADLGLFGRMLADLPDKNRHASSQVAHAISTHKVGMEFDYFTAVDDLKPEDTSGSDHIGTIEFNSACFYRYANVDVEKLKQNLGEDEELTKETVKEFIYSAIGAIPTGKQNSFATHEKPSFVLAVVRDAGFCSLANAFETPAKEREWNDGAKQMREGLVSNSIEKLTGHWEKTTGVYGDDAKAKNLVSTVAADLKALKSFDAGNVETLINNTMNSIFGETG